MSTIKERCILFHPSRLEWVFYNVILLYLAFFLSGIIHEAGHGIGAGLTGGTWGLTSNAGNIIGGYGLHNVYFVVPVFYVGIAETGNEYVMLILGPLITVIIAALAAMFYNVDALDGPCGGRNQWLKIRGVVWGLIIRGWFDAVYIGPIRVFPGSDGGDGMKLHRMFVEDGLHVEELFGISWAFSAGHVLMAVCLLVMAYSTYRVIKCSPVFCGVCKI